LEMVEGLKVESLKVRKKVEPPRCEERQGNTGGQKEKREDF